MSENMWKWVIKSNYETEKWEEDMFWSNEEGWTSAIQDVTIFDIRKDNLARLILFCRANNAELVWAEELK